MAKSTQRTAASAQAGARTSDQAAAAVRPAIRIPKTAELVAANIRKMIVRGEVREGDFLQPEAQLMEHFGTSRPTIREAFRILENEQLISVTRGSRSGARVHAPRVDSVARYAGFALQAQGTLLADIYLAREGIEPYAARIAAERATPAQVADYRAEIDKVAALYEAKGATAEFRLAITRLHHFIVEMAGSNTLTMISAMLHGVVEQHMSRYVARKSASANPAESHPRRTQAAIRSFRKLANLLEAHEVDAAEAHWREHLRNANAAWLLGYDETALVDVLD